MSHNPDEIERAWHDWDNSRGRGDNRRTQSLWDKLVAMGKAKKTPGGERRSTSVTSEPPTVSVELRTAEVSPKGTASTPRKPRGFAVMDPSKRREIQSKGGKSAHQSGRAHEFTPKEARAAGLKGGASRSRRPRQ